MSWLTNLFKRKKQDPIKKVEMNKPIPKPMSGLYYNDYTPTGRTEETRYVSSSENNPTTQNNGDFFLSMLAAEATDSAALGMMIGGDPAGAIIGDMLSDSNHSSNDYGSSSNDSWSSNNDYGSSSSDSSSSFDSSSSSSGDW
jgi:hypothetical protein